MERGINMQIIPITPVASQSFSVQLGTQNCKINLYQKGTEIVSSMICLNEVGLVRETYLGFVGQLLFIDTLGSSDPYYTDLGTRYILTYWTQS